MATEEILIFSEQRIVELNQLFDDKVAEVMRLQSEGKLPYFDRLPVLEVNVAQVQQIMNTTEEEAQSIMAKVRAKLGKQSDAGISVMDFIKATGLNSNSIQRVLEMSI
jgi:hypothetical protein